MSFKKSKQLRVYTSTVAGDKPISATLEYDWLYINIPDKLMWATQLDESTGLMEPILISSGENLLDASQYAAIDGANAPSDTNVFATIADAYVAPFKSYTAFITQVTTGAPSAAVVVDELGSPVWARTAVGTYTLTKAGAFTSGKTIPVDDNYTDQDGNLYKINRTSADVMTLLTYAAANTSVLADSVLAGRLLMIEVYN